jgi:GrpB-like predicted nucleotidyltransferase (UPF0157 family)
MIGLKRGIVKLLPYEAGWKEEFDKEKRSLKKALGDLVLDVEHAGSTAIPGMIAKPIIDIGVGVSSLKGSVKKKLIKLIEDLGYEYKADRGSPGRLFFAKGSNENRTHYLHLMELGNEEWKGVFAFRDFLRENKEWADKYARLKKELAGRYTSDREAYLRAKVKFIKKVEGLARSKFLSLRGVEDRLRQGYGGSKGGEKRCCHNFQLIYQK